MRKEVLQIVPSTNEDVREIIRLVSTDRFF